jgi:hypothetical protein
MSNLSRYYNLVIFLIFLCLDNASAVFYPQDMDYSSRIDVLLDAGFIWNRNSLFHPLKCSLLDSGENTSKSPGAFRWLKSYLDDFSSLAEGIHPGKEDNLHMLFIPGMGLAGQNGSARTYKISPCSPLSGGRLVIAIIGTLESMAGRRMKGKAFRIIPAPMKQWLERVLKPGKPIKL